VKKRRTCPDCGMAFKAMTDAQWKNVLERLHRPMSLKHKQRIAAKRTTR
jgi:hypothetical protein